MKNKILSLGLSVVIIFTSLLGLGIDNAKAAIVISNTNTSAAADVFLIDQYIGQSGDVGFIELKAKITNTTKINMGGTDEQFQVMFSYSGAMMTVDLANSVAGIDVGGSSALDWNDNTIDDGGWGAGYVRVTTQKNAVAGGTAVIAGQWYTIAKIKFTIAGGVSIGDISTFVLDTSTFGTTKPAVSDHSRVDGTFTVTAAADTILPVFDESTLSGSLVNSTQVQLGWSAGTDASAITYEVYRDASAITLATPISGLRIWTGTTTTYTDTTGAQGSSYFYAVRAIDQAATPNRDVAMSTPAYTGAFVIPDVTNPTATTPTVGSATSGSLTVTFGGSDNVGVTQYDIYYYTGSFTSGSLPATVVTSATSPKTISGLSDYTDYYFMTKVFDAAGNSGFSAISTVAKTADGTVPTVSGVATGTINSSSVGFTYTTSDNVGVTNTYIYYDTSTFTSGSLPTTKVSATSTGGTVSSLSASMQYYFMIAAVDAAGNTGYSAVVSESTNAAPDTIAPVISSFATGTVTQTSIDLDYVINETTSGVKIYYSTSSFNSSTLPVAFVSSSATTGTVSSLSIGTIYYFMVEAVDVSGNTGYSALLTQATNAFSTVSLNSNVTKIDLSANQSVTWSIVYKPTGSNGVLTNMSGVSTTFTGTVAGYYTVAYSNGIGTGYHSFSIDRAAGDFIGPVSGRSNTIISGRNSADAYQLYNRLTGSEVDYPLNN